MKFCIGNGVADEPRRMTYKHEHSVGIAWGRGEDLDGGAKREKFGQL